MKRQMLNLSTVLGTGVLCMTLAATPIAGGFLNHNASAAGGGGCFYGSNSEVGYDKQQATMAEWGAASDHFSASAMQDLVNSVKELPDYKRYEKFFDIYLSIDWDKRDDTSAQEAMNTVRKKIEDLGFDLENDLKYSQQFDNFIYAIKATDAYKNSEELRNAVAEAYSTILQTDADKAVAAAKELKPGIVFDDIVTFWDIRAALEVDYPEQEWPTKGYSEYVNYQSLYIWLKTIAAETSSYGSDYFNTYCVAKQVNPSFEVQHVLAADPLIGLTNPWAASGNDTGNGNASDVPSQSAIIESNDKSVKVSGANIKNNYTLTVDKVASELLKLTGDDFKNSINQAFYDIYVHDEQNNRIENTGKVSVFIKLPDGMSINSDFVVYYVPTAANGEYLADQAKAITGVKVSADGWLTFETDHFSVYGIVEYPKGKAPNTGVVAQGEGSASVAGVKALAGITSALTATGVAIVARRQILRKKAAKSEN